MALNIALTAGIQLKDRGAPPWGSVAATGGAWKLPSANYVSSKLSGRIISPRPDSETDLDGGIAYYRRNHSQVPYRVRISVKGMAWPLKYSLMSAPSGSTIGGELLRSIDGLTGKTLHSWGLGYAVVEWLSPSSGTETFTVQVEDQDGQTQLITWTTTQDDSAFVFVDSGGGSDLNQGTFAAPLETFANGLWKNSDADTTYAGKTAVFRGSVSDYIVNAGAVNTSPILDVSKKPACYMGFPDEAPVMDTSGGHWRTSTGSVTDLAFIGIKFNGSRSDLGNNRIFNILQSNADRQVFSGVSFSNIGVGTSGADNPCCIGHFGNTAKRQDLSIVDCIVESTVDTQLWVGFDNNNVIIENNRFQNPVMPDSNGSYGIHPKDDTDNITVRANFIEGTFAVKAIDFTNQNTQIGQIENQESCWNTVIMTGDQGVDSGVGWNSQAGASATAMWDYRNTAKSNNCDGYRMSSNDPLEPVTMIGNNIAASGDDIALTNYVVGSPVNQSLLLTDIDSSGLLVGAARVSHLGTSGSEVAS